MYALLKYLPRRSLSRLVGRLAYLPLPQFLATPLVRAFARINRIDTAEAARPIESFRSVGEYFIRDLRPEVRPIGSGVVSPVDGTVTEYGLIEKDTLLQVKGKTFSLSGLFCGYDQWRSFEDGYFVTTYLSPRNYHQIHSPVSGDIIESVLIPGDLWPVNCWSINSIDGLFTINERLIATIQTSAGPVAVVMVGATNVGAIAAGFDRICTNSGPLPSSITPMVRRYTPPVKIQAGERLAAFRLGSTVLVLFSKGAFCPGDNCRAGAIKFGQTIGKFGQSIGGSS